MVCCSLDSKRNRIYGRIYAYDIMDRVTNISWRTTSGATLGGFEYEYDAAGRIVSRSHAIGVVDRLASYGRARSPSAPRSVVRAYTYDAWGNVVDEEIVPSASALAALRYRFQGREWSAATGLVNFRMRWYDAETCRWLSKHPIRLMGGINLYVFCDGNPICKSDWIGLCSDEDDEASWIDWVQTGIDGIGVFDPTPISDGANAVIYLCRGKWTDAGISVIAMLPYVGDAAKGVKYAAKGTKIFQDGKAAVSVVGFAGKIVCVILMMPRH